MESRIRWYASTRTAGHRNELGGSIPLHRRTRERTGRSESFSQESANRRGIVNLWGRLKMQYTVKEIYLTLQGEGAQSGRTAVFCRFSGCNLWSGLEKDRAKAICRFCDTNFAGVDGPGGGNFESARDLANAIERKWPLGEEDDGFERGKRYAVLTGGEPLMQVDRALIDALHARGFAIGVETNGTIPAPAELDWICVSPKAGTEIVQRSGNELKLIFPQPGAAPGDFELMAFQHFYLQPMDGPNRAANTEAAMRYCLARPQWRLSLQTHKILGIP
jgi:7-carboxy-7-deazaguanine synthase